MIEEESLNVSYDKEKKRSKHTATHRREPHVAHPYTTKPAMDEKFNVDAKGKDIVDAVARKKAAEFLKKSKSNIDWDKLTTTKGAMKEDAAPVSVAGGAVPSITDPTTNYATQIKNKILKRAKPK